jgi:hypothetical protein
MLNLFQHLIFYTISSLLIIFKLILPWKYKLGYNKMNIQNKKEDRELRVFFVLEIKKAPNSSNRSFEDE